MTVEVGADLLILNEKMGEVGMDHEGPESEEKGAYV